MIVLHLPILVTYQSLLFAVPMAATCLGKWGVGSGHREAFLILALAQILWGVVLATTGLWGLAIPCALYCALDLRAYRRLAKGVDLAAG